MLAISVGANTIMQVVENVLKITYYLLMEYPGWLYILIVIPMGFVLMAFGLVKWGKVKVWKAILLTVFDFVGSMIIGIISYRSDRVEPHQDPEAANFTLSINHPKSSSRSPEKACELPWPHKT